MSKGAKIALGVLGVAAVGAVAYFVVKNARITRATRLAESEGFSCGGCLPSGVKICTKDGQRKQINCSYRINQA